MPYTIEDYRREVTRENWAAASPEERLQLLMDTSPEERFQLLKHVSPAGWQQLLRAIPSEERPLFERDSRIECEDGKLKTEEQRLDDRSTTRNRGSGLEHALAFVKLESWD